jgi:hypothetical protein
MTSKQAGLKKFGVRATVAAIGAAFALSLFAAPAQAATAALFLSPASGTFQVDSTFDISIFLNTQGNSVNTIDMALRFPTDKLQLVSTGTGRSIVGLWTSPPKYNNQTGIVELTGGVPGGVNVERGLITTLTFRAKAVGQAVVKFDRSKILLNDGLGTEVLTQNQNSIYDLVLPPPAGPVVVSETHPDQTRWYKSNTVSLRWDNESGASGFSYIVSDQPIDIPDEISEGDKREVVYRNLGDGRRYFHIRALRNGNWGGTTHYALNIDATPPADFRLEILPNSRTNRQQPVIQFSTTDALSGTDHYELKLVDVKTPGSSAATEEIFIEAQSPYIPPQLAHGEYDLIVRAYDKAGNYREVTDRLEVVPVLFRYISGRGLEIKDRIFVAWWVLLVILLVLIIALWLLGRRMRQWHRYIDRRNDLRLMPADLRYQMDELQRYRQKYGKLSAIILMAGLLAFGAGTASAQQEAVRQDVFDSPIVTTLSANITNEEIFYIGGKAGSAHAQVILYIQNAQTAETISETVDSDKNGDWFYRHDTFLQAGRYVMWAQSKRAAELSPPSPQVEVTVEESAIQFGATRVSYATLYMSLFAAALLVLIVLAAYIIYHSIHGRRKHALMLKEIADAQESLRRGFAVLHRDIQAELEVIKRAKLNQKLSLEERQKEEQLLQDMQNVQQYLSREIWDIESAENAK